MSDKKINEPPHLTQEQLNRLLKMEEEFSRCKWLYGLLATIGAWLAGIITVIYTTQDFIVKLYKALRVAFGAP